LISIIKLIAVVEKFTDQSNPEKNHTKSISEPASFLLRKLSELGTVKTSTGIGKHPRLYNTV